jgi:LysR family transcriptional activator of mexEF-oprN operon
MNASYGRDLDLNLLRVFVVVADTGSVTGAAQALYLTQPAVSAALRRLKDAVGAPLFLRHGRGLALTGRGERLLAAARPMLQGLVDATLAAPRFDPKTSDRTFRIGLSDAAEGWLLPPLLHRLERDAPRMRVIVLPVQFRTIADALATRRVDLAVTVADELPDNIRRKTLFTGDFVCLYDPRHVRIAKGRIGEREYLARDHVIVSYNGDLRGVVEDLFGKVRRVRCSVPSFAPVGAIVEGSSLLATVPSLVAMHLRRKHPRLATAKLPFSMHGTPMEMLWTAVTEDDEASRFLRGEVERIAQDVVVRRDGNFSRS